MNILEKIIEQKKKEVSERRQLYGIEQLQRSPYFKRETFSLKEFLLDPERTGIIAEFKRKSPSKGVINEKASVKSVTKSYAEHASGLSILTDEMFFDGSLEDLHKARFNDLPILRKDFIIDAYQVMEARAHGADVILLIASCLSPAEVKQLARQARDLGLEVLLELHDEEELEHICEEIDLIGINNRDLKTFEVSIQTSLDLIKKIPSSKLAIAESGISRVKTIVSLKKAGFRGFLIGENFMKEADPAIAFAEFIKQLKAENEN